MVFPLRKQTAIDSVVALDVGGTTISAGVVGTDHSITPQRPVIVPVNQAGTAEEILIAMVDAATDVQKSGGKKVAGVGIGMPGGPDYFDHERGISYVEHKFRSLYGRTIKDPLQDALGLPIYFVNDAEAFALGAWWTTRKDAQRLLDMTLGTGLGACFLVKGVALRTGPDVPKGGEIWNVPWRGGIVEDFVSRRFIEQAYRRERKERQGLPVWDSVKAIAESARMGNRAAKDVFEIFAENLGHALALVVPRFRPDRIVVGG
jgi:glucokinase